MSKTCCSSKWKRWTVIPTDIQIFTLGQCWQLCNKTYSTQTVVIWDNTEVFRVITTQKLSYNNTDIWMRTSQKSSGLSQHRRPQCSRWRQQVHLKHMSDCTVFLSDVKTPDLPIYSTILIVQIYRWPYQVYMNAAPSYHTMSGCCLKDTMYFWRFSQTSVDSTDSTPTYAWTSLALLSFHLESGLSFWDSYNSS